MAAAKDVRYALRAEADLLQIAQHSLQAWGTKQAAHYVNELEKGCQRVATMPNLGRACDEIRPGLRRLEVGSHVIFYRQQEKNVLIARVLHERMLPRRHNTSGK